MARFFSLALCLSGLATVSACSGGGTPPASADGGTSPSVITRDENGMGCVDVQDSLHGQMHKVCCHNQNEVPDPDATGACGEGVVLGCETDNGCVFYSNDSSKDGVVVQGMSCPQGMQGGAASPASAACR